ncbi:hypothetical protein V0U79_08395 [Hyphobacterium sp. HN65]|uniref:Secreted protein n=1 Tax=Hyphobacterium lacteum TaxID=3116575 RepID=A0ABU7LR47_9PROT|nr:hypothetical protein [Hyphobacterium sp. HN65]MEE2526383.1 hypothetical protein [Hyphobacterium sp. HN65]
MKRNILAPALVALTALASFSVAADAQQRATRANTQMRGVQANYEANTPYEFATCPIHRIWMTSSGIVFACDGNAMVFDGGSQPGGISAAMTLLVSLQENDRNAYVRYQVDADNPACSEMDYTHYQGMFGDGTCTRVVSFGIG